MLTSCPNCKGPLGCYERSNKTEYFSCMNCTWNNKYIRKFTCFIAYNKKLKSSNTISGRY